MPSTHRVQPESFQLISVSRTVLRPCTENNGCFFSQTCVVQVQAGQVSSFQLTDEIAVTAAEQSDELFAKIRDNGLLDGGYRHQMPDPGIPFGEFPAGDQLLCL